LIYRTCQLFFNSKFIFFKFVGWSCTCGF